MRIGKYMRDCGEERLIRNVVLVAAVLVGKLVGRPLEDMAQEDKVLDFYRTEVASVFAFVVVRLLLVAASRDAAHD